MICIFVAGINWRRFLPRHQAVVHPAENPEQQCLDLGQSYVEHHLTVEQLKDVYVDSYIDAQYPERSDGLSCIEAR